MPYVKNENYKLIPFSSETPNGEFYSYGNLTDLVEKCMNNKDIILRCRTVGILESINGQYCIAEMDLPLNMKNAVQIQVSMKYLKSPVQSTVIPYAVQLFGTLQWKTRPVIYAKIIQPLNISMAIRLRNALSGVSSIHLAHPGQSYGEEPS